ncbi:hypothetical protein ES695_05340 [Candidatus Atribacteria bacterium 1244-E10-H5-B2]|nr:MAG: hypothetical protein ES695_05340 [Candidatus Atribacteria bacterium 1244-E10-H5-B2]
MINQEKIKELTRKVREINEIVSKLDPEIRGQVFTTLKPLYFGIEEEETAKDIDRSFRNDLRKYLKSIADSLYKIEQSLYKQTP